jgi:hypothetical protein
VPRDADPYAPPFHDPSSPGVLMWERSLVVEHRGWLENAPGTGTAVECGASETYDGETFGNVDSSQVDDFTTTAQAVYVANKRNEANLTDAFTWSAANGFSGNLIAGGVPFDLIDDVGAAPQVGDYVAFGIDTTVGDSGPFCCLVFDVGTAGAGYGGEWQYWSGAAWVTLTVQDNTYQDGQGGAGRTFDTTDIRSVHWETPNNWVTNAVNGITGYWVRYYISAVPGPLTTPAQQNRDVYTVTWPYTEIEAAQVGGDIPALAEVKWRSQADNDGLAGNTPDLYGGSLFAGLRSLTRNNVDCSDFTAYFNAADEQNPAHLTVAVAGQGAFANDVQTPTGRKVTVTNSVAAWTTQTSFTIPPAFGNQYFGAFRVFIRGHQTSGVAGDVALRLEYGLSGAVVYTKEAEFKSTSNWAVLDFGKVTFPTGPVLASEASGLYINIQSYGDASVDFDIYDLILIPIDEWAIHALAPIIGSQIGDRGDSSYGNYLDIDSITSPKHSLRTIIKQGVDDSASLAYMPFGNKSAILQNGILQRLWFLQAYDYSQNTGDPLAKHEVVNSIRLSRNQRYLSMRGDR